MKKESCISNFEIDDSKIRNEEIPSIKASKSNFEIDYFRIKREDSPSTKGKKISCVTFILEGN